ncbi:MAG: single-stranded-DNA-specific exonuclease RecJ [Chloroflexota bacterium]
MKRPNSLREYRWRVAPRIPDEVRASLANGSQPAPPLLHQILYNRGLTKPAEIQAFLDNRYTASRDPFLLAGMETAVNRIIQAINNDEQIVVYGDFDADGVTATVLLTEALRGFVDDHRQIRPYIPDRVDEGYGLNLEAVSRLREMGATLLISVDCGIRSPVEVAHAQSIGLDMIITDHHSIGHTMPDALAVINPKRPDSTYPETMLAGVGIAYKVAQALRIMLPNQATFEEDNLLDLVAIGTVADLAPLQGENRKLVAEGLSVLNEVRRPGLAALMNVSGLQPGKLSAENIGFGLGPRINAAGRLAHAYDAAKLLTTTNYRTAQELAQRLDSLNRQRQSLTAELTTHAEELIDPEADLLIAGDSTFESGVVGLVASRLAESYYRPTIIMEQGEEESRGSCRSIPEFHITHALDEVSDLLERHGGHAQAAGFTIRNENLPEFTERMQDMATAELSGKELRPALEVDAQISLNDIDWSLQSVLSQLEPTGYSNPTPRLLSRNLQVRSHRAVGRDGSHLQLVLASGEPHTAPLPAIAFRQGAWAGELPDSIDAVYSIGVNEWQGSRKLQLMIEDIRPAGENGHSEE